MTDLTNSEDYISIGELAGMTGVGVHTLRVWEKRYGSPCAKRLPSGHRRYPKDEVPRLRAIAKAIESGYRPGKVVTASMEELQALMGMKAFIEPGPEKAPAGKDENSSNEMLIEAWIRSIHSYDDENLLNGFHEHWGRHGALNFIVNLAAPLLERVGKGWETAELTVAHEHFASECMVSFLSEKWRRMNIRKSGPTVLIATLPGEEYNLGILMCAVASSATRCKVIYLGVDNPVEEITLAAKNYKPQIIAFSVSHMLNPVIARNQLSRIRSDSAPEIKIVTGGKGSPQDISGISYLPDFNEYYDFLIDCSQ